MAATDRVAVIGAGPIGLYAAFRLVQAGHRVVVWEKGSIGANVEQWGHVTLFSAMDTVPDCVGNDVRAMQMRRVGPFGG